MSRLRRKGGNTKSSGPTPVKKKQRTLDLGYSNNDDDDHIESEDEEEVKASASDDEDIEEEETLDAKKIRLARQYLRKLEASSDESDDDSSDDDDDDSDENDDGDDDHDRIGRKLQRERLKLEGGLETAVADNVNNSLIRMRSSIAKATTVAEQEAKEWVSAGHVKLLRGHDLTPTCVALQSNGAKAVSGSKDHSVILWDVENECKDVVLCNTWKKQKEPSSTSRTQGEVLSTACSDDGRYVAIGKRDATVSIFDIRAGKNNVVNEFTGHKGPVTSLAFRMQTLQLFSGSEDRCIRHYNLNEMMYVETLYGHQSGVTGIDCHRKERPISVGKDRTARAWKLAEDTHLIYRGGSKISSAACVNCVKEDWYMTGHDDGHLALWMTEKKKAVATIESAHGSLGSVGRGIECVGSLRGSDLAITGSSDGYLRLWKIMTGQTLATRGVEALNEIPLTGFVNGIVVGPEARFCVVAAGQEPRLGRWDRVSKAKNRFGIVRLSNSFDGKENPDENGSGSESAGEESDTPEVK